MYTENEINVVNDNKISSLRSSISDLRDQLYVRELKNDLKEFVNKSVDIKESQSFLKTEIINNVPSWFQKASLTKIQTNLIATSPEGEEYIFFDYFKNFESPSILTENGLMFNGSLIEVLAGPLAPRQYAQAQEQVGGLSIGEVSSLNGVAKAIRLDGNQFDLSNGDPVFEGDTIEVSSSGAIGLIFLDKTTLSLSEGGKMVLDELVYDPASGDGNMAVDMVEGAFSFISGEIAKSGEDAMTIKTPVATIGIRGTTVAGKAAVEGNENSFTLLQDADGGVGEISISNAGGTQVLGQVGATTSINSFNTPPPVPVILSAAQIQANYGTALNVLPPTPAVAPTPQEPPQPQEQQQEEVEEEISEDESDEEIEEALEQTVSEESEEDLAEELEVSSEEAEEGLSEEEGLVEEELGEEETPPGVDEAPDGDQQTAREAFDTALASGASPEQAMAEAAAAGGFDEPPGGQIEDIGPLGGGPLEDGLSIPGGDFSFPGATEFSMVTGLGLTSGPMNVTSGPALGMGTIGGLDSMNAMVGGLGLEDTMFSGALGFGDPLVGFLGSDLFSPPEVASIETPFFEDPALYDDFNTFESIPEAEESDSSSSETQTEIGTSSDDTIDKSNATNPWILDGLEGSDTIKGGDQNDIIVGGLGADSMTGGLGDDKFYYKQGHADANFFDKINDFRQSGAGNDQITAGVTQTTSYSRIPIYNDSAPGGANYIFNNHSNQIPIIFNFTHDTTTSNINTASSVSSYLDPGFWVTPDGGTWTSSLAEQFILVFGDGNDTYTWLWEDTSKGGAPDADELYPLAILPGFDNDTMDGTEFNYETISGV